MKCVRLDDYVSHNLAKGFLDSNINEAVIDKLSIFHEIAPKFHILTKIVILQV